MKSKQRKILSIVDNAFRHVEIQLSNIDMIFFPRKTTSLIQRLDAGIIKSFKDNYENFYLESHIFDVDEKLSVISKQINIFDVIQLTIDAWRDVITECTIIDCFNKAFSDNGGLRQVCINELDKEEIDDIINEIHSEIETEVMEVEERKKEIEKFEARKFVELMEQLKHFIESNAPKEINEY